MPNILQHHGLLLCRTLLCGVLLIWAIFLDPIIQPRLHELGTEWELKSIVDMLRKFGEAWAIIVFILCGIVLTCIKRQNILFWYLLCLTFVGLTVQGIKHSVGRARPSSSAYQNDFYGPLAVLRVSADFRTDSLPSGHTAVAFAMATCLSQPWPRLTCLWFLLATGVGVSRIIANAHFSSDVSIGALIGISISKATENLLQQYGYLHLIQPSN
jgi:membrane-associated phospholipid phosphatase